MVLKEKTMNEFYLSKQSQEYLIEEQIYQDIYQYREKDNITLKMLSSIILNNNQHLFIQVLQKRTITSDEHYQLLKMICEEGENYLYFFQILYKKYNLQEEEIKILIEKSMISNSIKILQILFMRKSLVKIDNQFIHNCLHKNPSFELLEFLCLHFNKSWILNQELLKEIINNDYVKLFEYYTKNQISNDWNAYLHDAIQKNAYDIIDYILSQIEHYETKEDKEHYNDFFDYLMTEKFQKIINFLNKTINIFQYGHHNLEKLLLSFEDNEQFEVLLFDYNLISISITNELLSHRVNKYILNNKLNKTLKVKNKKEIKKI